MAFRVNPYLQQPSSDGMYITWFTEADTSGDVSITGPGLDAPLTFTTSPTFEPLLGYTNAERNQEISGLEQGSWLLGDENYKHTVDVSGLQPDSTYTYTVTVDGEVFAASFTTAPTADDWESIRFMAFSDSETEPRGRVNRRDWQQGALDPDSLARPSVDDSLWAETLGTSGSRLDYPLTENVGYLNNLEIINSRNPDFLVMPGDLIQGGGYQPAWDEFFRHNAGEFDSGLSEYPILPALGNWENFGALNGGYSTDADGRFGPLFGRQKFAVYFDAPANGTPEHQDNYYRIDYGPVTILTLDSSNGEPDDSRNNYGGEGQPAKISGLEFTGTGTDTQQNYTREQYEAEGGTDLADFNPGSPQWNWVIEQLEDARANGQMVFAQFHHAPYSNGTHGLPMNHENSSGQGGTPMRQYQPLFEQYGVVAVFSGHSEMFERSFVDEDGDGLGVYYYDVGVAGDGMRGQRTDANGDLLGYNAFSQWTADQSEPELWAEVDGVLQNITGGKHYGHLEVNVQRLGDDGGAEITFTPVYSFPILDSNYELIDTERRVYGDEITLQVNADGTLVAPALELALYDTDTNELITVLRENNQLFASDLAGGNVAIAAYAPDASPLAGAIGSVALDLNDGQIIQQENVEPYALFGDRNGNFFQGDLDLIAGSNTLSLDIFAEKNGKGDLLDTVVRKFTVVDDLVQDVTVGLYDADTDSLIQTREDGAELAVTSGQNLTDAAVVNKTSEYFGDVESMFLNLNEGQVRQTENVEPYALFGDRQGDFRVGSGLSLGDNTISLDIYSKNQLNGELLDTITRSFTLIERHLLNN
ncbi:MAG: metallophosphoesterase [Leptolyngbyaceae cyanobacterium]